MLRFSFSTILMTVLATNLLAILLTFCFRNTKIMINAGYKLLALFILFTLLRFVFPFEFSFRILLVWPDFISSMIWRLHYWLFEINNHPISIWTIFKLVWIIGIIINFIRYCNSYIRSSQYITLNAKVITNKKPFSDLMDKICHDWNRPNHFVLIEMPNIKAPVLYGIIKPRILIPENLDLSEQDWYYVLQHEASHHFHHDILMKNIIKFITMIYWWNPFCIILNKQADVILEMRVDDSLTLNDYESTENYLHCLLNVSERIKELTSISKTFSMSLLPAEISDMGKRFHMLISNQKKRNRKLNILLFTVALTIYILSYVFIVEAALPPQEVDSNPNETYDKMMFVEENTEFYIISNSDGTYSVYLGGECLETVASLEYYPDVAVYTEENFPK